MEYLLLGFFTGLSLILAIGAQKYFVIEQGFKKTTCISCLFNLFNIGFYINFSRNFSFSVFW
jgi:arginine exporter protein ArgO